MTKEPISVTVKFFANLRKYGPEKAEIILQKESTVRDILTKYDLPFKKLNLIIMINGKPHQTEKSKVNNGDTVAIFPQLAGG